MIDILRTSAYFLVALWCAGFAGVIICSRRRQGFANKCFRCPEYDRCEPTREFSQACDREVPTWVEFESNLCHSTRHVRCRPPDLIQPSLLNRSFQVRERNP